MIGEHLDWKFEYDDHNRVVMSFDPAGLPIRYEYGSAPDGSLNRITAIPPEGVPVAWNLSGDRIVEMHDSQGSVLYQYDEFGNLVAVERANSPAIRYSYDADRRMTEMRVGDSYHLAWSYDYLGRVTSFQSPAGLVQYDYQSGMSEVRRALPNGITTFWKTAPHGRLANITHGFFPNPRKNSYSVLAAYDYSHGPEGRIAAVRERSPQGECAKQFAYDTMGRLARATGPDRREYNYRYDDLGNRTQATLPGGKAHICEFDWAGRLVSVDGVPVTYDLCGNVIGLTLNGVERSYRYRPDGRLAEVITRGDTVRYAYDGNGRLVVRESKLGRTTYIVDPLSPTWHPLEIREPDGTSTQIIWEGDRPLALVCGRNVQWLLGDHLDSVRLIADNRGVITRELTYDPFGVGEYTLHPEGAGFGYSGLLTDLQAGGLLTLARVYVPELGCFLQPDPQRRMPSASTQDLAPYSYCGGDPINFVDRDGAAQTLADIQFDFYQQWMSAQQNLANIRLQAATAAQNQADIQQNLSQSQQQQWQMRVQMQQSQATLQQNIALIRQQQWQTSVQTQQNQSNSFQMLQHIKDMQTRTQAQSQQSLQNQNQMLVSAQEFAHAYPILFAQTVAVQYVTIGGVVLSTVDVFQPGLIPTWLSISVGGVAGGAQQALLSNIQRTLNAPILAVADTAGTALGYGLAAITPIQEIAQIGVSLNKALGIAFQALLSVIGTECFTYLVNSMLTMTSSGNAGPSPVGGVNLTGAARALDGLGQIKGVRVDANGNIGLICEGESDVNLPSLRLDDIVTVFRSVYLNGEGPTVTIDPDPADPERAPMLIKHSEATAGTYVGWVLYEADRLMKTYSIGRDNNNGRPTESRVPGFDQMQETMYFGGKRSFFGANKPRWERFWIVPAEVDRFDGSRRELTLFDLPLKVKTQAMQWKGGKLVDDASGSSSPGALAFTDWFRKQYDGIAAERYLMPPADSGIDQPVPVFAELQRIALLTAIAEKLREDGIPMPAWMKDYAVKSVTFEETTPVLRVEKRNGGRGGIMVGGVNISADPMVVKTYESTGLPMGSELRERAHRADQLELAAAEIPVTVRPFSVQQIGSGNHAYKMITLPGAQTQALNPGRLEEVDLIVPVPGGSDIRLVRSFNSFFAPSGPWGDGWALDLPRLDNVRILSSRSGDRMSFTTGYDLSTPLNSLSARFKDVRPVAEYGGNWLQVPEHSGPFLGIADGHPNFPGGAKTTLVILKSGEQWHFTPRGELVAVNNGPQTTLYERDAHGHLTRIITLIGGTAVAQIALEYEGGRMKKATSQYLDNSSREVNKIDYHYDANGQLSTVTSETGVVGYEYHDGLLSSVSFKEKSSVEPKGVQTFIYNEFRELTQETFGDVTINRSAHPSSDGCESIAMMADGAATTRYDRQFRLVDAVAPDGSRAHRTYRSDGSTVTELSLPGSTSLTITESVDARTRTAQIAGAPTVRAQYDDCGRLTELFENQRLALTQRWNRDGQLAAIETATNLTRFEYDAHGVRTAAIVTPPTPGKVFNLWRRTQLDRRGNPVEITDHTGLNIKLAYDPSGALISAIRKTPEGNLVTNITRDEEGRVQKLTSPWGETSYCYDPDNRVKSIEIKYGSTSTRCDYEDGKLQSVRGFDGGVTKYGYFRGGASGGLLANIECANGLRIEHDYNGGNRQIAVTVGKQRRVKLSYDKQGPVASYSWEQVLTNRG